ncbi:hypothetical protein HOI18_02595 [Candidatus Uhrbacteria bacterium]|jgi:hypothetical protein|nr:hypothetical protein [Candidatus Uhrbacteria bacterium]
MRYYHRHSFFPLVIILLTLGLILFMFYAFSYQEVEDTPRSSTSNEVEVIDADSYREEVAYMLAVFEEDFDAASDDLSKLVSAEDLLASLLELTVPSEYKVLHLELAVVMNKIQVSLRSSDRSLDEPVSALEQLKLQYPWLEN